MLIETCPKVIGQRKPCVAHCRFKIGFLNFGLCSRPDRWGPLRELSLPVGESGEGGDNEEWAAQLLLPQVRQKPDCNDPEWEAGTRIPRLGAEPLIKSSALTELPPCVSSNMR